ncbi:hypothetical protein BDV59DRAFT_115674 [Aspergillus ambiguus]|uniref:uncharacterized protein n=1 Tax=Aspergillus ambiguus TaxID=176160 RepID=UPI003CCCACCB
MTRIFVTAYGLRLNDQAIHRRLSPPLVKSMNSTTIPHRRSRNGNRSSGTPSMDNGCLQALLSGWSLPSGQQGAFCNVHTEPIIAQRDGRGRLMPLPGSSDFHPSTDEVYLPKVWACRRVSTLSNVLCPFARGESGVGIKQCHRSSNRHHGALASPPDIDILWHSGQGRVYFQQHLHCIAWSNFV